MTVRIDEAASSEVLEGCEREKQHVSDKSLELGI